MSTTTQHLERAALDAHRAGMNWDDFWNQHGGDVKRARAVENRASQIRRRSQTGPKDNSRPAGRN